MLSNFFNKSVGNWISHRSYYYVKKDELINSTTEFKWSNITNIKNDFLSFEVSWNNEKQKSVGKILCHFKENDVVIYRDSGYFTANATESKVIICSDSILKTITEYNNMRFVETIEFLTDVLRVRRTVAYSLKDESIFLIGNYVEHKKED